MTASKPTPREGDSADGRIEYSQERMLRALTKKKTDELRDYANLAGQERDMSEAAMLYRELAREAIFLADLIEELGLDD